MKRDTEKNKKDLIIAMEKHLGIVTAACKDVGLCRDTFYTYYKTDAEFRASIDEINEYTTDFVESQLLKKIKQGSERSILFYMKYKGRKRGYTESISLDANIKMEQPLLKPLDDKND
jgi:hypothetical protein